MKRLLLSFAILVAGCSLAITEEDTSYYLMRHESGNASEKNSIEFYAQAIENGMGWSNNELKSGKQPQLYCLPDNLALTGSQILDMVRRQVAKQKPVADTPFGLGIMYTLREVFPCKSS